MLLLVMLIYVTILTISMLFLKQAHRRPTWSSQVTWWAPCCWPMHCTMHTSLLQIKVYNSLFWLIGIQAVHSITKADLNK